MKRKLKYNLNSTLLTVIVIALVVFFNVVVAAVTDKFPAKFDFSGNQLYAVSDETTQVLNSLEQDVHIYYVTSAEIEGIAQTLDMYKMKSNRLKIETRDPITDPAFIRGFRERGYEIVEGDIVVESGNRVRRIDAEDMYYWAETEDQQEYPAGFQLEQKLTTAISYVAMEKDVKVAFTTGHGESYFDSLAPILVNENIAASKLDLRVNSIEEDCSALYIVGPQYDFSDQEINKITNYVAKGGSVMVCYDFKTPTLPKFEQYLSQYWGISFAQDIVIEQNSANRFQTPTDFYAVLKNHDSVKGVNNDVLWGDSQSLKLDYCYGVQNEIVVTTAETGVSISTKGYVLSEGEIPVAAVLEKTNSDGARSRMFVSGSRTVFAPAILGQADFGNRNLMYSVVKYLNHDDGNIISVSPKKLTVSQLNISDATVVVYIIVFAALPALAVLITGFIVWMRRRHL